MPPREVVVACENPRAPSETEGRSQHGPRGAYEKQVARALERAGEGSKEVDWAYVERLRLAGVDPQTAAAMVLPKPHAHAVVGIAAEGPRAGECDCEVKVEKQGPPDSGPAVPAPGTPTGAFSKVTKDPSKFEAARARAAAIGHLDTDAQLARFLRADLEKEDQEVFVVVGFDIHNDLRCYAEVARGQRAGVRVEPADILRPVLIEGCVAFAVAHNHPTGHCAPSAEDRKLTAELREAALSVRLRFLDHLVIGSGGSYYSFADKRAKKMR